MLKKTDLKYKAIWQKWNGFLNLVFLSGFVENIREQKGSIVFDVRQTGFISHGLKVVLDKGVYLPPSITENAPVKLYARLQQDIECNYPSLILRPIYCARAALHEIPSDTDFLAKGKDSKYKIINPYLTLDQLADKPRQKQQMLVKKFQNNVEIAGFVRAKKRVSEDCIAFELWNQKVRVLPIRLYGKNSIFNQDALTLLRPVKVNGRVEVREIMLNDKAEKQIYVRADNVVFPLTDKEIPSIAPDWYEEAIRELRSGSSFDEKAATFEDIKLKEEVENNPVIDKELLDKVDIDKANIFLSDDSIIFDEDEQDIKIVSD